MCVLLILICSSGMSGARADQISDLEDEVSENEKKYDKIQKELDELEKAKDNLENYISELNDATAQIEAVLDDLELQIQQKDNQIKDAQAKIAVIDKKLEIQYENMKLRIKYLYESNDANYMDVIFSSSESFSIPSSSYIVLYSFSNSFFVLSITTSICLDRMLIFSISIPYV